MYDMTLMSNASSMVGLVEAANEYTGNVMVGMFMIAIFFIMLLVLKKYDFTHAMLSSSLVCFLLSLFLVYIHALNFMFPLVFLAVASFATFWLWGKSGGD